MAAEEISGQADAAGLAALISRASDESGGEKRGLPPVERWNPPFCGDIDMISSWRSISPSVAKHGWALPRFDSQIKYFDTTFSQEVG